MSELSLGQGRLLLDPALVVRLNVVPSGLEFVAHGPHEVTLDGSVEDVHGALAELHNLVVAVEVGVDGTLTVLDDGVVAAQTLSRGAVGAVHFSSAVEVNSLLGEVRGWAVDALASTLGISVGVVEAAEPGCAHIGGEGPLAHPDVVFDVGAQRYMLAP